MKFEVLKKNHLKRNIIIGLVLLIISAIVINFARAKYKTVQALPLINGTVNYSPYDFKMIAIYQKNDSGEYVSVDIMPSKGYVINEEISYCEVDGKRDHNAKLYTDDKEQHVIANLQKGTKCYLYFDEKVIASDTILANKLEGNRGDLGSAFSEDTTGKYFTTTDWDGTTYYFAGNPTDNWVKFAGFYWRIIRINGDGSIRLIYQGTSANITGEETQIGTSKFNNSNHSRYVGLVYGSETEQHGYENNSIIMGELNTWYTNNIKGTDYEKNIDTKAGFCSDRGPTNSSWNSNSFAYLASERINSSTPSLNCGNNDILAKDNERLDNPIGLITADEVMYGGMPWFQNASTTSNYLYTGQTYWTMTPFNYISIIGAMYFT